MSEGWAVSYGDEFLEDWLEVFEVAIVEAWEVLSMVLSVDTFHHSRIQTLLAL